jgi:hypothetical protein
VNLPETGRAKWGEILDAEKMKKMRVGKAEAGSRG